MRMRRLTKGGRVGGPFQPRGVYPSAMRQNVSRWLWLVVCVSLCGCPSGTEPVEEETGGGEDDIMFPDEAEAAAPEAHPATDEVRRGEAALARGDSAEALAIFEAAIAENPSDPRAQLDMGLVLELGNDYQGAERAYRAALELDADFPQALNNLGLLLRDVDRAAEAVPLLQRAVEVDTNFGEAWLNLAMALEETGSQSQAREAYRRAVRLRPEDGVARANLGLLLLQLGEDDQAAIELRRALPLSRGDAAALQAIGLGLRRAGQPGAAVQAMEMAIEAHGEPTPALLAELALAQRANEDPTAAEATLTRAIELDARFAIAHTLLGSLMASRQAYREAIPHFERYLALEPNGSHAERTREHLRVARVLAARQRR